MSEEILRKYLEIKSPDDLNEVLAPNSDYSLNLVDKKDFQYECCKYPFHSMKCYKPKCILPKMCVNPLHAASTAMGAFARQCQDHRDCCLPGDTVGNLYIDDGRIISLEIENEGTLNNHYLHTVVKDNIAKLAVVVSLETKDDSDVVKTFGKQLSMHIAASNPIALESSSIDQAVVDKEQELVTEELKNSGKPEEIAKKISLGKMNKFKEENALLSQAWVMEPKKKVQDIVKELSISDLKIKEFYRIKIGE